MDWSSGNWLWVLVAIAAVWFFMRRGLHGHGMGGHGGHHGGTGNADHGHGGSAAPGQDAPPRSAAGPEAALDPVSGNPVRTDRALTAVFGGRAYYFESDDTRKRFEAESQKYASAAPQPRYIEQPRRRRGC